MRRREALSSVLLLGLAIGSARAFAVAGEGGQPGDDVPVGLEVRVLDGLSGGAVHGVAATFTAECGPLSGRRIPLARDGDAFTLEDTGFLRGERAVHGIGLDLPEGWVREREGLYPRAPVVTLRTRTVSRTVIVWPEADLRARVLKADGTPAAGASLVAERVGERLEERWTSTCHYSSRMGFMDAGEGTTGGDGAGRVGGVPSIPGARYRVMACWEDRFAVSGEASLLHGTESLFMEIRLPEKTRGDAMESTFLGSGGVGCAPGLGQPARGEGRVRVAVRWLNGDPARGLGVTLSGTAEVPLAREGFYRKRGWMKRERTGDDGIARFAAVPVGKATARVEEPGFVRGKAASVVVRPGEPQVILLEEGVGRGVVVRALDTRGESVPGVDLIVCGLEASYAPVDAAGVQEFALVTGAGGLAFLPRVPPGGMEMRATLGTRTRPFRVAGERVDVVLPDE